MNPSSPKAKIRRRSEDVDRLSNLPEPIIHYIFSFLETIDVVRSRGVSKRWRYLWLSMPYLNFDTDSSPNEDKFKNFVNWVLMSQNGSIDIKRFRLHCFLLDDYLLNIWISVAALRNVQQLHLSSEPEGYMVPLSVKLPHCLVTCESLVSLKIDFCCLTLPTNASFSRLKSLEFKAVRLSHIFLFGNLISSCPFIENLIMESCYFMSFEIMNISSTSLKNLRFYLCEMYACDAGEICCYSKLKFACPNLVSFTYIGEPDWAFSFEDLNSLQNVSIKIMDTFQICWQWLSPLLPESDSKLPKAFKGICKTKVMDLWLEKELRHSASVDPECFSSSFCNLRSLTLAVGLDDWDMDLIIKLLNCSPNLEALTISFDWREVGKRWIVPDNTILCLTNHLKTIKLVGVTGSYNELNLIRFLLKNGHVLQKMSIKWVKGMEIMKFPRSSPNAVLAFL